MESLWRDCAATAPALSISEYTRISGEKSFIVLLRAAVLSSAMGARTNL